MVDFVNEKEFEAWLKGKPREWGVVLASRAALRVLPAIAELDRSFDYQTKAIDQFILPTLHLVATAWVFAKNQYLKIESGFRTLLQSDVNVPLREDTAYFHYLRLAASAAVQTIIFHNEDLFDSSVVRAVASSAQTADGIDPPSVLRSMKLPAKLNFLGGGSIVWHYVSIDATALEKGLSPEGLATKRLWLQIDADSAGALIGPSWVAERAIFLQQRMSRDEKIDWGVWVEWYNAVLRGSKSPWPDDVLEILLNDDLWLRGDPKEINSAIREVMNRASQFDATMHTLKDVDTTPSIPPPRPAAIEPVIADCKIVLPKAATASDLKPPSLGAALKALREQIEKLAEDYEKSGPNPDRRMIAYLRGLAMQVPKARPKQQDLFAFGHEKKVLEGYASKVNEEWPEIQAARYHAMTLAFDLTLKQFPKWREFLRNASGEIFTPAQIKEINEAAKQTSEILRNTEASPHVDPALPEAINALNAKLDEKSVTPEKLADIDAAKQELAADLLESLNNTWKRIAESAVVKPFIGAVDEFKKAAPKSIVKEGKRLGDGVGPAITKWAKRLLIGSGGWTLANMLVAKFPAHFAWLEAILNFFRGV